MDLVTALDEAASALAVPRPREETLRVIAEEAQRSVPGIDHVGISFMDAKGVIHTLAATDRLVNDLDSLQYELNEGPCVDSIRGDTTVVVDEIAKDPRWPRYVAGAVPLGLRAQLAIRLNVDEGVVGGLNLYATSADTIDPEAPPIASLFATHASIALGWAHHDEQLTEALATRTVIGQATGIVMERFGVDADRAFHYLARISSTSNTKLRLVAESLVEATVESHRQASQPLR